MGTFLATSGDHELAVDTRRRSPGRPPTRPRWPHPQAFYEQHLGLVRSQAGPPHAVLFETKPIAFALRDVVPGTDLATAAYPGIGAAIWLHATDVQAIHDALVVDSSITVSAPVDGPFGRTFTLADPDGYHVTLHDRA